MVNYLLFIFFLFVTIKAQNTFWEKTNGPPGGIISAIAIDNSGKIYIGTEQSSTIFCSNENGNNGTWQKLGHGLPRGSITSITINNQNEVFASIMDVAHGSGIYKSTDFGNSWNEVNNGLNISVTSTAIDSSQNIYAGTLGLAEGGIYKTTNSGETWGRINFQFGFGAKVFTDAHNSIFALSSNPGNDSVYISNDEGNSWQILSEFNSIVNVLRNNNNTLFLSTNTNVYKSTDEGISWTLVSDGIFTSSIKSFVLGNDNSLLVLSNVGNIYRSIDNGITWEVENIGFTGLLKTSVNNDFFYCGTVCGKIFRSTNFGAVWADLQAGINFSKSKLFTFKTSNWAYASNEECAVYRTSDKGASWQVVSDLLPEFCTSMIISTNGTYFAGGSNSIFRSDDNGDNWYEVYNPISNRIILFADNNNNVFCATDFEIRKSTDLGTNWYTVNTGINVGDFGITNNNDLVAIGKSTISGFGNGIFARSTNNGESWENSEIGVQINPQSLTLTSTNSILFNSDDGGDDSRIYRSIDNGISWNLVYTSNFKVMSLFSYQDKIYAGYRAQGVLVSYNDGISWSVLEASGLSNKYTYSFSIDLDGYLYLSAYESGLWDPFEIGIFRSVNTITSIKTVEVEASMPNSFELFQNYPNPFNPTTKIKFQIPAKVKGEISIVQLKIYDILGNEVATLVDEQKPPGTYEVDFNGNKLSSGIYFYKLMAGEYSITKKMLLLK